VVGANGCESFGKILFEICPSLLTVVAGVQQYALHLDKPEPEKPTHC